MVQQKIPEQHLSADVNGLNLADGTFGDQWRGETGLLVFLRHLG